LKPFCVNEQQVCTVHCVANRVYTDSRNHYNIYIRSVKTSESMIQNHRCGCH